MVFDILSGPWRKRNQARKRRAYSRRSGSRPHLHRRNLALQNGLTSLIRSGESQNIRKRRKIRIQMPIFKKKKSEPEAPVQISWARPEMQVTFRAEIMPGRTREERTYRVKTVRANGRVELHNFVGEHRQGAFEPINFLRDKVR